MLAATPIAIIVSAPQEPNDKIIDPDVPPNQNGYGFFLDTAIGLAGAGGGAITTLRWDDMLQKTRGGGGRKE